MIQRSASLFENKNAMVKPDEVLDMYARLLGLSKSSRVSKWSTRTVERALGWADLKEKVVRARHLPCTDKQFALELVHQLAKNPFASREVRACAGEKQKQWDVGATLPDPAAELGAAEEVCANTIVKRLKMLKYDEADFVQMVIKKMAARSHATEGS